MTPEQQKWFQKFKGFSVDEPKQLKAKAAKEQVEAGAVMKGHPGDGLVQIAANSVRSAGMLTDAARLNAVAAVEEQTVAEVSEQMAAGGKTINAVTCNFQLPDGEMMPDATVTMTFQSRDGVPPTTVQQKLQGGVCTVKGLVLSQAGLLSIVVQLPAGISLGKVRQASGGGKWALGKKPYLNVDARLHGQKQTATHKQTSTSTENKGYEGSSSNEVNKGVAGKLSGSAKVGVAGKAGENLGVESAEVSGSAEASVSGEVSGSYATKADRAQKHTAGGTTSRTNEDTTTESFWEFEAGMDVKITC